MILGIDPGKNGALVWLNESKIAHWSDMPQTIDELVSLVSLHAPYTRFAVIEDVSAMTYVDKSGARRGQGAKASFNFGFGAGILHGVLAALKLRVWPVKPSTWKLSLGLSADKNLSRAFAAKAFKDQSHIFSRAKDDGRAEAALIAYFGSERFK